MPAVLPRVRQLYKRDLHVQARTQRAGHSITPQPSVAKLVAPQQLYSDGAGTGELALSPQHLVADHCASDEPCLS